MGRTIHALRKGKGGEISRMRRNFARTDLTACFCPVAFPMWYGVTCIIGAKLWSWKHGYAVAEQRMDGLRHPLGGSHSLQRVLRRSYVIPTCSHGTFLYNAAVMLLHTLATLQTAFFIPIGWLGSQPSSEKLPFSVGGS